MNDHDPTPLADPASGAPPFLRDALRSARAELPDPQQLERLSGRLPLGGPGGPPPAGPPSILSGALIGAALGALVSGAGFVWEARREAAAPATPSFAAVSARATPPATSAAEAPRAETEAARAPLAVAPSRPVPAVPASPAPASVSAEVPAPPGAAPEASPPVATAAGASLGGAPVGRDDLRSEVELIAHARDLLGSSPAEALAVTEKHAARFPGGALAQEREVLAIEALRRLGRADEARARKDRFLETYPGSAHRPRLEGLFGP